MLEEEFLISVQSYVDRLTVRINQIEAADGQATDLRIIRSKLNEVSEDIRDMEASRNHERGNGGN